MLHLCYMKVDCEITKILTKRKIKKNKTSFTYYKKIT